jgi:hypothetical protein
MQYPQGRRPLWGAIALLRQSASPGPIHLRLKRKRLRGVAQ